MINQSSDVVPSRSARKRDLARESPSFLELPSAFSALQDLTDRVLKAERDARDSEQRYRDAQIELARANRVAMLGQGHRAPPPKSPAALANAAAWSKSGRDPRVPPLDVGIGDTIVWSSRLRGRRWREGRTDA